MRRVAGWKMAFDLCFGAQLALYSLIYSPLAKMMKGNNLVKGTWTLVRP